MYHLRRHFPLQFVLYESILSSFLLDKQIEKPSQLYVLEVTKIIKSILSKKHLMVHLKPASQSLDSRSSQRRFL